MCKCAIIFSGSVRLAVYLVIWNSAPKPKPQQPFLTFRNMHNMEMESIIHRLIPRSGNSARSSVASTTNNVIRRTRFPGGMLVPKAAFSGLPASFRHTRHPILTLIIAIEKS
jgi:hypothetical protein